MNFHYKLFFKTRENEVFFKEDVLPFFFLFRKTFFNVSLFHIPKILFLPFVADTTQYLLSASNASQHQSPAEKPFSTRHFTDLNFLTFMRKHLSFFASSTIQPCFLIGDITSKIYPLFFHPLQQKLLVSDDSLNY